MGPAAHWDGMLLNAHGTVGWIAAGFWAVTFAASSLVVGCVPFPAAGRSRTAREARTDARGMDHRAPAGEFTPIHPVLAAYEGALRSWMTSGEEEALSRVAHNNTLRGSSQRLRYLAADRAVRRILPLALEAQGSAILRQHAEALRALPPLLNAEIDDFVRPRVAEAIHALRRHDLGLPPRPPSSWADLLGVTHLDDGSQAAAHNPVVAEAEAARKADAEAEDAIAMLRPERDPEAEAFYAQALAEYAETYQQVYGVSALHADTAAAAAADAVDVAFIVRKAVDDGANRDEVVAEAVQLYGDMVKAAQRRERVPSPSRARQNLGDVPEAVRQP